MQGTTQTLTGNVQSDIILATDTIDATTDAGTTVYYYVVVEYENATEDQNTEMGKEEALKGQISVELAA